MKLTVLVPTYRRPKDLQRCLAGMQQQIRPANQVLLVVRDIDIETWRFLETFTDHALPIQVLTVTVPGVIAAINVGFDAALGDIVSVTDDDAVPHPDWLARIEARFLADNSLGGVGGRDWMYINHQLLDASNYPGASQIVGKLQWFGRHIGNHHLGEGEPREVDILKGVNMSYRRSAIATLRCDERFQGTGAQVHFEMALSLAVKRNGWKLIYDPAIAVDHYPAQRFDEDQRIQFNYIAECNEAHNETLALLDHLTFGKRLIFLIWALLVGTRGTLGIVQLVRFLPQEGRIALQRWWASMHGRWQGYQTWMRTSRTQLLEANCVKQQPS